MSKLLKDDNFTVAFALTALVDYVEIRVNPKKPRKKLKCLSPNHDLKTLFWCGLAVITAVSGAPTSEIQQYILDYRKKVKDNRTRVQATSDEDVASAFDRLGFEMKYMTVYGGLAKDAKPLFSKWLKDTTGDRHPGLGYLVMLDVTTENHWVIVLNDHYFCSKSTKWIPVSESLYKDGRVMSVYTVRKI